MVRHLTERMRQIESAMRAVEPATIPFGSGGLGELFPGGRLAAGSLVELVASTEGAGCWTLALALARQVCADLRVLLVADPQHGFYPPAAMRWGMNPRRVVVVRTREPRDALLAVCQSLRCPAVGAAVGQFERLGETDSRRLQLAAEAGGSIGVLVRPASARMASSFAAVRLWVRPVPMSDVHYRRRLHVDVLRCRGGQDSRIVEIEINDETGDVRALARLATATASARAARPTG
jgi:protein ImuA